MASCFSLQLPALAASPVQRQACPSLEKVPKLEANHWFLLSKFISKLFFFFSLHNYSLLCCCLTLSVCFASCSQACSHTPFSDHAAFPLSAHTLLQQAAHFLMLKRFGLLFESQLKVSVWFKHKAIRHLFLFPFPKQQLILCLDSWARFDCWLLLCFQTGGCCDLDILTVWLYVDRCCCKSLVVGIFDVLSWLWCSLTRKANLAAAMHAQSHPSLTDRLDKGQRQWKAPNRDYKFCLSTTFMFVKLLPPSCNSSIPISKMSYLSSTSQHIGNIRW